LFYKTPTLTLDLIAKKQKKIMFSNICQRERLIPCFMTNVFKRLLGVVESGLFTPRDVFRSFYNLGYKNLSKEGK